MAEHIVQRLRPAERRRKKPRRALTPDEIAAWLVPRRDRFVRRLPSELLVGRRLSADQAELVVDEAMDYLVTQYTVPIYDAAELERAFWAAAAIRAKRMHDGRAELFGPAGPGSTSRSTTLLPPTPVPKRPPWSRARWRRSSSSPPR